MIINLEKYYSTRALRFLKKTKYSIYLHRENKPAFVRHTKAPYWPDGMFMLQYWKNSHWLNTEYKSNLNNNN